MFSNLFYKPLSGNTLYGRFLLTKTMEAAKSPDDVRRVDADDPSGGETILDDLQGLLIAAATESRHDHRFIGDIEVGIRGWKSLILIDHRLGHRQLDDIQLLAVQQPHFFQIGEVVL